jgi:general stress protein 26
MSTEPTTRAELIAKLAELIKEIDFAMLTTVDENDGTLRSRPMSTQKEPFDGDLWFFTEASAPKVDDVQREQQVNLAYADPKSQRYVSMSGTAQLVRDLEKKKQLWEPTHKIYFPNGPEDPNVALLKVTVSKAEYWESGSNPVTRMFDFAKALVTGDHEQLGENKKVNLAR